MTGRFPFPLPNNPYHSYYLKILQETQEVTWIALKLCFKVWFCGNFPLPDVFDRTVCFYIYQVV
jgi:hypothetical protein